MSAAERVSAFLSAVTRRLILIIALYGVGVGIIAGTLVALLAPVAEITAPAMVALVAVAVGFGCFVGSMIGSRKAAVMQVERRAPQCRNLILTASELMRSPDKSKPYVMELVTSQAAAMLGSLSLSTLFPLRRALTVTASAVVFSIATLSLMAARGPDAPRLIPALGTPPDGIGAIEVAVTPPIYTGRKAERLTNPSRVEAVAGSRIRLTVRGATVRVETVEGEVRPVTAQPNVFELIAERDGFIALRSDSTARRLIGLTVTPDQAPRVKVIAPGKDMFLADPMRRIPVAIEARDDIALGSLKLRYTKVSGSGERFTFTEGELPITIARPTNQEWRAQGTIDLGALQLQQGDMLVYRGAATDGRPGSAVTESDAFIIELTSPGSVSAEGFSADDEMDKYALSQQMVILKTERLLARAATLAPDSLEYYSQSIAAEQRSVRAEFVFMMGGEVAQEVIAAAGITDIDETHEAENESELAAGRLVNRGRNSLINAIRRMSRASTRLNAADPIGALPEEKAALVSLQEAFSRTRYILRALTLRERLDLSRRLTGVLELAARDTRPAAMAVADPAVVSLRRALAGIASLSGSGSGSAAAVALAQQVLRVDPSDATLQDVSAQLGEASRALQRSRASEARRALDEAATSLVTALRVRLPREYAVAEAAALRELRGALSDARRRGGAR